MSEYKLDFTDIQTDSIFVDSRDIDTESVDITLFGFKRLNYGEELNENFVHLLENFASEEDPSNPGNPDTSKTNSIISPDGDPLLKNGKQIEGQIWFNKSNFLPYIYHDNEWRPLDAVGEEITANWGQILNGEQIPRPATNDGYVFPYSECSWIVSPFNQLDTLETMICRTDENANVTMEYVFSGSGSPESAVANYMIVGIKGNNNLGDIQDPNPPPTPTPSGSMGATPTPSASVGASPTPTPTPTPDSLTLTINDPFSASCAASSGSQCIATDQIVLGTDYNIAGGSGNFSYNWSYFGGDVFSISNPSSPNPSLSRKLFTGLTGSGIGTIQVSDLETGETTFGSFTFNTIHNESLAPTPSQTPTSTPAPSNSADVTPTPTPTPSNSAGVTPTPTPSISATPTPTPSISATPTPTPSEILSGTISDGAITTVAVVTDNPATLSISLLTDGSIDGNPSNSTTGANTWAIFNSGFDASDFNYEIIDIQQANVLSFTGPSEGSVGSLSSDLIYSAEMGGSSVDRNLTIILDIVDVNNSTNVGRINLTLTTEPSTAP